jgi:hypothetical protein
MSTDVAQKKVWLASNDNVTIEVGMSGATLTLSLSLSMLGVM